MSRYARKKDANHGAIVKAIEFAGCSWLNIETSTAGAPDGVMGCSGATHLVEIKPDSATKKHALRPNQVEFAAKWRGSPVHLLRTPQEAWELVALLRMTARTRDLAAMALADASRISGNVPPDDERTSTRAEVAG